jgi:hypothetical protein
MGIAGVAVIVVGNVSCSGNTSTSVVAEKPTTAATTPESPASSPTPTATPTVSLAEWRAEHGTNLALVIATANGLVSAIDKANETQISKSCDALKNNYRNLLRPIPAPPGPLGESRGKWDGAKDEIYAAQSRCSGGLIRSADLHQAQLAARDGIALLHEVLGPAT